ncbi:leukocyte elastase inhibitor-like [Anopheles cruzii]|uniref:leukocyte elastase inhibitor-like n=1 Tax=Anopheles cruzii TaxID=68878 RepID=UPI0022EC7CD7|nr:leukocyte elastase inhibitor-like [Anopheles cruzii]
MVFIALLSSGVVIDSVPDPLDDEAVVRANRKFSVEHFKACFDAQENTLVSPYHIRLVLSALYPFAGAAVQEDFRVAFGLPEDPQAVADQQRRLAEELNIPGHPFRAVPFLVAEQTLPLAVQFGNQIRNGTAFEAVDLTDDVPSAAAVNAYYQRARIELDDLITEGDVFSLEPHFKFMAFSGVSLMGPLPGVSFLARDTKPGPFRFVNVPTRQVPIMSTKAAVRYGHHHELRCAVVELPLGADSGLALQLLLPDGGSELETLVTGLNVDRLKEIEDGLRSLVAEVRLPRFMVREKTNVKTILAKLGYGGVFEINDLNVFLVGGRARLDGFFQHCYLAVEERGATETTVAATEALHDPPEVVFNANRPFLFLLRRVQDGNVLMVGHFSKYIDPDEQF